MPEPTTAERLEDAALGLPDTIADYIGQHCPTEFPWGADKSAELIMTEIVTPLLAERERARRIAVALEQENAHLTEQIERVRAWATSHEYRWLHELLDGYGTHGGHL